MKNQMMFWRLSAIPLWCAVIVSFISILVLVGWTFEIDFLKRIIPGYVMMNPATAIAFVLSSVALWLLQSTDARRVRLAQICAAVVLLAGFIKLCELLGLFDIGIDRILFSDHLFDPVMGKPNRMAPNTALNFFLTGAALLLYKVETKPAYSFPAQHPAILVVLTSFVAIIGYFYGATSFYLVVSFNPMAIHTATSFLLLAGGLLLSKPGQGIIREIFSPHLGGQTARRLFPLFVIIPVVLGWLRLYGEKKGVYGAEMGTAILIVAIIIVLSSIVIYNARLTNNAAVKLGQTEVALNNSSELLGLLSESEKSYRQLADSMPQIVWTARPDGFLDYYNERWFDYTGMTLEQTEGWGWEAILHPDDLQNCVKVWSEAVETGEKYKVEYRFRRASDNEYRWHFGQALPVRDADNKIVKWFGTCTDIHGQKRAEEELRQIKEDLECRVEARTLELSVIAAALAEEIDERKIVQENLRVREERFQLATRATNDVIWDWDLTTNDLLWNHNFQKLFGYSVEEIGTDVTSWTSRLHADDLRGVEESVHHAIESGEQSWAGEYRFRRRDDSYAFVTDRGFIVYDKSGKPVRMVGSMMDITERRQIEEALRQSELKFRSVTESANDAIVAADSKGNIISWNNGAKRIFGYTDEEALNKPLTVLMPEVYREAHRLGMERYNQTGEAHVIGKTVELIGLRKDSSEFPLELSLTSWTTGKERFYSGIIRDITERKRAENALEEAARRERAMIDNALDVICTVDAEGRFASVSPACFKVWGYQPEELVGRKYIDLVLPEDIPKTNEVAAKIISGEELTNFENRYRHKNGTFISTIWTSHWSESEQLMFAVAHDNTERKLAEEKLIHLSSIVESSDDAIISTDLDSIIISWNNGAERLHGYAAEEVIGKNILLLFPPGREDEESGIMERIRRGESVDHYETVRVKKDGRLTDMSLTISPIKTAAGEITGASKIARDITERKRAEEELKDFAAQLKRSNAELQDFASVASHDLQEPLRKVQAFGDRLKTKCGDALSDDGRDYLERMQNAAGRMQTLITDLLTFSRVTTQAQPFVPVDLRRVTNEVLSDLETRIETTNGTIEIGELATIDADPTQMRQLLQNLIGNALKFNRPGVPPIVKIGGQICHNFAADKVEPAGATYCLTVEDNGIGFEDKYVEKIFKVFQRLHGRSEYEGTGIGLSVCRKIAERHGGSITATSVPNEGTTFTVILPDKQQVNLSNE